VAHVLGATRACLISAGVAAGALFLVPLAAVGWPLALLIAYQAAFGIAAAAWSIVMATLRQSRAPADQLGRVSTVHGAIATATLPLGTMLAGLLAGVAGLTNAILVLCVIAGLTPFWYATPAFLRQDAAPVRALPDVAGGQA
jgi:hypothetical protein